VIHWTHELRLSEFKFYVHVSIWGVFVFVDESCFKESFWLLRVLDTKTVSVVGLAWLWMKLCRSIISRVKLTAIKGVSRSVCLKWGAIFKSALRPRSGSERLLLLALRLPLQ
jgi:hypothetical protein